MNRLLTEIIVNVLIFFEMSDDEIVHPDAAVEQIEIISYYLKQLSLNEQAMVVQYIQGLAKSDEFTTKPELREFLLALPENLGIQQ